MTSTELFEKYNCVYGYMVSVLLKSDLRNLLSPSIDSPAIRQIGLFIGLEKDVQGFIDVTQVDFFNAYSSFMGKKYDYKQFLKDTEWSHRKFPVYKLF